MPDGRTASLDLLEVLIILIYTQCLRTILDLWNSSGVESNGWRSNLVGRPFTLKRRGI